MTKTKARHFCDHGPLVSSNIWSLQIMMRRLLVAHSNHYYLSNRLLYPFYKSTLNTQCLGGHNNNKKFITTTADTDTSASNNKYIRATQKWFDDIVIGQKLCPFAPPFRQDPSLIRIVHSNATNNVTAIQDVEMEIKHLLDNNNNDETTSTHHETTLVVFHCQQQEQEQVNFVHDFRSFVSLSWKLQEEAVGQEYLDRVQLVLFHPRATHQTYGEGNENPADYTIRSPYPTIHLLREQDVLEAVQGSYGYPNLETLPARNKARLMKQGLERCQRRLDECYS
jgi:hypothetical protein